MRWRNVAVSLLFSCGPATAAVPPIDCPTVPPVEARGCLPGTPCPDAAASAAATMAERASGSSAAPEQAAPGPSLTVGSGAVTSPAALPSQMASAAPGPAQKPAMPASPPLVDEARWQAATGTLELAGNAATPGARVEVAEPGNATAFGHTMADAKGRWALKASRAYAPAVQITMSAPRSASQSRACFAVAKVDVPAPGKATVDTPEPQAGKRAAATASVNAAGTAAANAARTASANAAVTATANAAHTAPANAAGTAPANAAGTAPANAAGTAPANAAGTASANAAGTAPANAADTASANAADTASANAAGTAPADAADTAPANAAGTAPANWRVVVGSFRSVSNATLLYARLVAAGYSARLHEPAVPQSGLYRVEIVDLDEDAARNALQDLSAKFGIRDAVIRRASQAKTKL